MATAVAEQVGNCHFVKVGSLKLEGVHTFPQYSGVACVSGHRLILVDRDSRSCNVSLHDHCAGNLLSTSHRLPSQPWDVCVFDGNELQVAVSLWDGTVQILSVQSNGPSTTITKVGELNTQLEPCHGVRTIRARARVELVVCGFSEEMPCWRLVSASNGEMGKISEICKYRGFGFTYLATSRDESRVYISFASGLSSPYTGVYGYDIESAMCKFTYNHIDLTAPRGLCVDSAGYIYVSNLDRVYCIHQLTEEGKNVQVFKEGIPQGPTAICFDDEQKVFFLTNFRSATISKFRMKARDVNASESSVSDEESVSKEPDPKLEKEGGRSKRSSPDTAKPPFSPLNLPEIYGKSNSDPNHLDYTESIYIRTPAQKRRLVSEVDSIDEKRRKIEDEEKEEEKGENVLPPEILRMDEKSQRLYKEALAAGKELVYNIRVMIVGHQGVGKTSLTRRLLGEKVLENETETTEGISVHARCCQIDHDSKEWKRKKYPVFSNTQRIAEIIVKHLKPNNNYQGESESTEVKMESLPDGDKNSYSITGTLALPKLDETPNKMSVNTSISTQLQQCLRDEDTNINKDEAPNCSTSAHNSPQQPSLEKNDKIHPDEEAHTTVSVAGQQKQFSQEEDTNIHADENKLDPDSVITVSNISSNIDPQNINSDGLVLSSSSKEKTKNVDIDQKRETAASDSHQENINFYEGEKQSSPPLELKNFVEGAKSLTISKKMTSDVTLLDLAGQFLFYTTHQLFMSWRTLYLLVTNMSLSLTDRVHGDSHAMDVGGNKTCSMQDYVVYWMNSIHSHLVIPTAQQLQVDEREEKEEKGGGKDLRNNSICPPVILVGTHVDKIPRESRDQAKKSYFQDIRRALKDRPLRYHLVDEDFAISNLGSDANIDNLKLKIFETVQNLEYWGTEIPARWIILEQDLMEMKAKGNPVIDYAVVESLNESHLVKIEQPEELILFLKFEHDLGNIVFFSTERLRKKVVLDPEWLIGGLNTLITSDHFIMKHSDLSDKWFAFKETGRLTKSLIDRIWSHHPEIYPHQDHLLDVMEMLNIIARPLQNKEKSAEDDHYWVPCMINRTAPEHIVNLGMRKDTSKTSTLCFRSKTQFIHVGVFHRLLATCLSRWPPAKEGTDFLLFSGLCVFELDVMHNLILSLNDIVIHATVIRYTIRKRKPEISLCIQVRDYLQSALSQINECLCPGSTFEICIKCKESSPLKNEGIHGISFLRDNVEIRCDSHKGIHCIESAALLGSWEGAQEQVLKSVLASQAALSTERQIKLYSLLVNVGPKVLRRLLLHYTVTPHSTLDMYLKRYHSDILKLMDKRKILSKAQFDVIFPSTGKTDLKQYDITLASALLCNIVSLGSQEKQSVQDLREERNDAMHSTKQMTDTEFKNKWTKITTILTEISRLFCDDEFEEEIHKAIQHIHQF